MVGRRGEAMGRALIDPSNAESSQGSKFILFLTLLLGAGIGVYVAMHYSIIWGAGIFMGAFLVGLAGALLFDKFSGHDRKREQGPGGRF